jgi:hypothetical protein
MVNIDDTIAERTRTHGPFADVAQVSQDMKTLLGSTQGWLRLTPIQRESMEMILHKIARILSGDPGFTEHWHDLAGYATLVEKELNRCAE